MSERLAEDNFPVAAEAEGGETVDLALDGELQEIIQRGIVEADRRLSFVGGESGDNYMSRSRVDRRTREVRLGWWNWLKDEEMKMNALRTEGEPEISLGSTFDLADGAEEASMQLYERRLAEAQQREGQ